MSLALRQTRKTVPFKHQPTQRLLGPGLQVSASSCPWACGPHRVSSESGYPPTDQDLSPGKARETNHGWGKLFSANPCPIMRLSRAGESHSVKAVATKGLFLKKKAPFTTPGTNCIRWRTVLDTSFECRKALYWTGSGFSANSAHVADCLYHSCPGISGCHLRRVPGCSLECAQTGPSQIHSSCAGQIDPAPIRPVTTT
jgi:hypothetical protein